MSLSQQFLYVSLGAVLGANARFGLQLLFSKFSLVTKLSLGSLFLADFPWPTFFVNVMGSFLIGFILARIESLSFLTPTAVKTLVVTGFLGSFTTFSAFSMDSLQLLQSGKTFQATTYVALSITLGLAAVFVGFRI